MKNLMINYLDLLQLVAEAVVTNNQSALNTYKLIIQSMIDQYDYEYNSYKELLYLLDDCEIANIELIKHCLNKLMSEINKALY